MKKKRARRILSLLLVAAMLLGSVQVPAFAAQTEAKESANAGEASVGEAASANDREAKAEQAASTDAGEAPLEQLASEDADSANAQELNAAAESDGKPAGADGKTASADEAVSEEGEPKEGESTAGVNLLEGETKLEAMTLGADLTLTGNYVLDGGCLNLDGHTLTINGNLLQSDGDILVNGGTLVVTGDYRIQNRKSDGDYEWCGGALVMTKATDNVRVDGEFYVSGDTGYWNAAGQWQKEMLTAGTLTIGRGLHQLYRNDGFRAMGEHKTIFAGAAANGETSKKCSVSFTSPDSCLGMIEMAEDVEIDWTGYFNVETLGNDVAVTAPVGVGEGITIYSNSARMNFNGHNLTVNGNVRNLVGELYVGGAHLAGSSSSDDLPPSEGDNGLAGEAFDPEKAGSLAICGDFLQQDGDLVADGGKVRVDGDWRIQHRKDDGTYEWCNAALVMTNEFDDVRVGGDFYISGDTGYWNLAGVWQKEMLTAGTLTIGRSLHQLYRNDGFRAQGEHKTIFAGAAAEGGTSKICSVSFASPDSCLGMIEMAEDVEIDWTGYFNVETLGNDVAVTAPVGEGEGITIYSEKARMSFNTHRLTVNGNVRNLVGELYVGGEHIGLAAYEDGKAGSLEIHGDFLQQDGDLVADGGRVYVTGDWRIQHRTGDGTYEWCGAALVMTNAYDDVRVDGDFYVSGDTGYWNLAGAWQKEMLTAGTLTIGRGLHQLYRNDGFRAQGEHKTIFAGAARGENPAGEAQLAGAASKACTVSFASPDSCLGVIAMGDDVDISWTGYFNAKTLGNYVTITTPTGAGEGITMYSERARMDFNGNRLTINGNVRNLVGEFYVGGVHDGLEDLEVEPIGSLVVNGNLLQQDGDLIVDAGHVTVTGDWRIQHRKDDGTYEWCGAALVMTNEFDDVRVGGDFYVSGDTGYWNLDNVWQKEMLTAGTLTLAGSFYQLYRNDGFRATGALKTVLAGEGTAAVQFGSSDSYFATLELANAPENYIFSRVPCWTKVLYNGEELTEADFPFTGIVNTAEGTITLTKWPADSANIEIPSEIQGFTVTGLGAEIFKDCANLETVTLPGSLVEIKERAFAGCASLAEINFPASLTTIGGEAFRNCTALASADFPASLITIGSEAFRSCTALTAVEFPASLATLSSNAVRDCKQLAAAAFAVGGVLESIGSSAFEGCESLLEIRVPDGTTRIDAYAFYGCKSLKKAVVPGTVKEMGNQVFRNTPLASAGPIGSDADYEFGWTLAIPGYAFDFIETLERAELPETLTKIGKYAFSECHALREVVLPAGLTESGETAFYMCRSLTNIEVPAGVTVLARDTFHECRALEDVVLHDGLTEIGRSCFEDCVSLPYLEIPEGVTTIRAYAFWNCEALEQLFLPESAVTLEENLVKKTDNILLYVFPGSAAEQYAIANDLPYTNPVALGRMLTANVLDEEGKELTGSYTVSWYDAANDTLLGTGKKLRNVAEGTNVLCKVVLGESYGRLYSQPDYATITVGNTDAKVDIPLSPFAKASVRGTVKDADGNAISGAAVLLRQTFNGMYEDTREVRTDENGGFAFAEISMTKTTVTVSADGYYDQTATVSEAQFAGEKAIEAVLEKIPEDKVNLEILVREAYAPDEEEEIGELRSTAGLVFTVYNETKGKQLKENDDFRIQYPFLTLRGDAAAAGDTLRLSLAEGGTLTAADTTVTLDGNRCGNVSWTLVRNGRVRFAGIQPAGKKGVAVMLFENAEGNLVESGDATTYYESGSLPQGSYMAVFLEKSSLLRSVESIAMLGMMGLSPTTDYTLCTVQVSNGSVTVVDGIKVPAFDESKLYYTVADQTRVWANYKAASTGQYVTVRAMYEIDEKYASEGETLLLEIPEGLTFVERSLTVGGKSAACTVAENEDGTASVTIPVNARKSTVRFYVLPNHAGTKTLHGYLYFRQGGAGATQPIGSASIEVANAALHVPAETSQKRITVTGKAIAGCDITVYDNGTKVGTTTSNRNGSWSLSFDLVKPYSYSHHELYAAVESEAYGEIETDLAGVFYNEKYAELSKVTMINTAHTSKTCEFRTVFDFLHPSTVVPSYNYWPAYPTFTFLVEFSGGNPEKIQNVQVVTTNSAGDRTMVPCYYDAASGAFVGTHAYRTFEEVPCAVGVACENASGSELDAAVGAEELQDAGGEVVSLTDSLSQYVEERASTENEAAGNEKVSFDLLLEGEKLGEYSVEMLDYAAFDLTDWETGTYMKCVDQDGRVSYESEEVTDDAFILYCAYPAERLYAKETLRFVLPENEGENLAGFWGFSFYGFTKTLEDLKAVAGPMRELLSFISNADSYKPIIEEIAKLPSYRDALQGTLELLKQTMNRKSCKCIDYASSFRGQATALQNLINLFYKKAMLLCGGSIAALALMQYAGGKAVSFAGQKGIQGVKAVYQYVMKRFGSSVSKAATEVVVAGGKLGAEVIGTKADFEMGNVVNYIFSLFDLKGRISGEYNELDKKIRDAIVHVNSLTCPCNNNGGVCMCEHPGFEVDSQPVQPIADPSGYVYEAVPSNRLEDVNAAIYEYTYAMDEFGVPAEEKSEILWDAASYDQVNPQTTREDGTFGWDVPEGQWLVKFTKDGYYDADSHGDVACDAEGYLPVPPIQTEVNTAMVAKAAPEVANVAAYPTEVQFDFTQYMQIDTVNAKNVSVTVGGKAVSGTIVPLDAEDNYEKTAQYASQFAYRFASEVSGNVAITIKNAKNYNGKAMTAAYTTSQAVAAMPKALEISGAEALYHHENAKLTIKVLPAEAGANRTLTVEALSPSILAAAAETVQTDANGVATVTLSGVLPGEGILGISLDGTKLSEEVQRTVYAVDEAPQVISLEEGGFAVTLSEDSFVYDGTAKEPVVTIEGLAEGTDFTVAYQDNLNAGTATAIATGIGGYTGTLTKEFVIAKAKQKLSCKTSLVAVGEKAVFAITGAQGAKFAVSSSNTAVLKVVKTAQASKKFQVQAFKVGSVKLTIKVGSTDNYAVTSIKVTVKVVPAATTKIQVTNLAKGLKVAWAKVSGATGYLVYCNNKLIKTITNGANSLTHTKANTNGSKYVYKIVATAATGTSTLSKSATAYRLAQPTITTAKNSAAGTIGLKWSANAKATGYQVQYSLTKDFKKAKTLTVKKAATVTAKITKLTKGKSYYVRVRSYKTVSKANYFSAYSAAKAVKVTK